MEKSISRIAKTQKKWFKHKKLWKDIWENLKTFSKRTVISEIRMNYWHTRINKYDYMKSKSFWFLKYTDKVKIQPTNREKFNNQPQADKIYYTEYEG